MTELRRIMLVEDDHDIAMLARIALEEFGGFELVHYPAGPEALAAVDADRPDLIILDYRMPGMNGAEVMKALRETDAARETPVLFMTASLMPGHVGQLLASGALAVLPKPFDPLTLSDEVQRIWEQR